MESLFVHENNAELRLVLPSMLVNAELLFTSNVIDSSDHAGLCSGRRSSLESCSTIPELKLLGLARPERFRAPDLLITRQPKPSKSD